MSDRAYIRTPRAWYAATALPEGSVVDELILSQDDPQIEVVVQFHRFPMLPDQRLHARFGQFDDSWGIYRYWHDLFDALAEASIAGGGMARGWVMGPDEFEALLKRLGFTDKTPTAETP